MISLRPRLARALLLNAVLVGLAGDSLLRDGIQGVAFPLWIGIAALNLVALVWKADRTVTAAAAAWLCAAFAFSIGLAWRNADNLQAFDFLATAACLAMAALTTSGRIASLVRAKLFELLRAVLLAAPSVIAGLLPTLASLFADRHAPERERESSGFTIALRAGAITAILLVVFGSLLRGADPIFASFLSIPEFDAAALAGHAIFTAILAWLVAGWISSAISSASVDGGSGEQSPLALPRLGNAEITTALGALNALFALYVGTQIAWFFGGEKFLRAHTGLTVAAYARSGFFQMLGVAALVVPVLVGTRALLPATHSAVKRHTTLSVPLLGLLAVMVASAVVRVKLYVHFYGLTTDRFYGLAFMTWVAFVLVWLGATVLRDRAGFVAGAMLSGLSALAALNVVDPDAMVARVNIERAARLGADQLDVSHLATLHGGGVPLAMSVVLDPRLAPDAAERCTAARELLKRWGPSTAGAARVDQTASWRLWNADNVRAIESVGRHASELRAITHAACPASRVDQR